jgi:23S rRNA pseudouridine1911/1915/1917 synthase
MGAAAGETTLVTQAKAYLKQKYQKPGNVYLGVVSRLDTPVTGVVIFARTSKAAQRLTEQFRTRVVEKTYWAIVEGLVEPAAGESVAWVAKDERAERMRVVGPQFPGAKEARLSYRRLAIVHRDSLVEVTLETGRKHQIRLQLADRGHPILGDAKYGSRRSFPLGIALHARRLVFVHPVRGERIELLAPIPASWRSSGVADADS